jgi:hypothetical protein
MSEVPLWGGGVTLHSNTLQNLNKVCVAAYLAHKGELHSLIRCHWRAVLAAGVTASTRTPTRRAPAINHPE